MLIRRNVWSYLVLVALPLAAARCGGDDDDSGTGGAGTKGGTAGAAGKGTAGKGGSSGRGGAGKGGSSNSGGEAGDTSASGSSGKGGTANASAGESGQSGSGGSSGRGGSSQNGGETNGGEAGSNAGESSEGGEGGEGGAPACSEYPFVVCSGTLNNVGTGDFEIDFLLTTTQSEQASVLDQRPGCGAGQSMWSVRIAEGKLFFEGDDGATEEHYAVCHSETAVNDGNSHWISYRRVGGELRMYIDCKLETTCPMPASFESLPTVNVGHGVCDLPPESGGDGTHQLDGTVEHECVGKP